MTRGGDIVKLQSVGLRLVAVILTVALPLAAAMSYIWWQALQDGRARELELLRARVSQIDRGLQNLWDQSEWVLSRIAKRPAFRGLRANACGDEMATVQDVNTAFLAITLWTRDGNLVCSSYPLKPNQPSPRPHQKSFDEGLATDGLYLSNVFPGQITGLYLVTFTYPVRNESGETIGLLSIPVRVDYFEKLLRVAEQQPGSAAGITDRNLVLVARIPEDKRWQGKSIAGVVSAAAPAPTAEGALVTSSIDGVRRIVVRETVPITGWRVFVGVGEEVLFAGFRKQLVQGTAVFAIVLALSLLLAYLISRGISRPLRDLVSVTDAVAQGNHGARAAAYGQSEIALLAGQVNRMLDALEQSAVSLRESEARFRTIFETEPECVTVMDGDGFLREKNAAGLAMLEADSLSEARQQPIIEYVLPEYRASFEALRRRVMAGESGVLEYRFKGLKGTQRWLETHAAPLRDASGRVTDMLGISRDITERKKSDEDLRRFRAAMEASGDAILLIDRASMRYIDVNQTFCDLVGYAREEVLAMTPMQLFSADRETLERDYDAIIADRNSSASKIEGQYRRKDGVMVPIETRRQALRTKDGWIIVGTARDITERKEAEAKIGRLNRVYAVLSGINAAIVRIRSRAELFEEACRISLEAGGFSMVWIGVVDRASMEILPAAWRGPGAAVQRLKEARFSLRPDDPDGTGFIMDSVRTRKIQVVDDAYSDPRIRRRENMVALNIRSVASLPLVVGDEAVGVLALHSPEPGFFDEAEVRLLLELSGDISFALEHIEKSERVNYLAYYDELTGLANRRLFAERISQYARSSEQAQRKFALILVDVERFKAINDSLGRQAGDELLKQIGGRLGSAVNSFDIARTGGDHFAIVLPEIKGRSEVGRKIERIWNQCFAQLFRLNDVELRISAKAGIALYPSDGTDADTLFASAEAAQKKAQETGERHVFHTQSLTEGTAEQLSLENKLRQALERDEFVLHYQPKVDLETRRIVGVEALIRWQSPELGLVPPMKFIPLMEKTGLILDVGAWALDRAIKDHFKWIKLGLSAPRVAVNVSAIQLRRRDFVFIVENALTRGATPPGVDLEITESLVMEDIDGNMQKLKDIRDLGLSIAIDDFGTGYSSLGYLAKLPVQTLKIDRSFIITMLDDPSIMTLVQTIISLAHSLKLRVIAEGVDSEEQAKMLRLLRCDEMQGYLFSRPVPFDQITAILTQGTKG